jgi:ABC-type sugar transport system permease subunit
MPKNGLNKGQIYFFLPAIIVISFIFLIPIINLFKLSFQDINIEARTTSFVGLQNYATLLKDNVFIKSVRNNLILISMVVPVLTVLCILFSVLLFECRRDFKFFQVTIFLPYILSITVVGILFTILLQKNGPINDILKSIGFGFLAIDWLGNPRIAILTVGLIIIWKELGFGTTLFLSRLMGISSDLIAAADIDGANWWRKVISIYIPHLSGIIFFYITLTIINLFSWVFNYIYVITRGGPGNSTYVFEFFIYNRVFWYNQINYASSAAVIVFVSLITVIYFQMRSRAGLDEKRDIW